MAETLKNALGSDYINFLGNIAFLKGWPIHKVTSYPSSCMFQNFSMGYTIVRDSNESDWIYIVKSGSISVMKKLRHVVPRRNLAWERENQIARRGSNVNVPFRERRKRKKILPPLQLPDVPKPEFHSHFELQMKMEETIPGAFKENDKLRILDYDNIIEEYKSCLQHPHITEFNPQERRQSKAERLLEERVEEREKVEEVEEKSRFPKILKTTRGVFMSTSKPRQRRRTSVSQDKENMPTSRDNKRQDDKQQDPEEESVPSGKPMQHLPEVTSPKPGSEVGQSQEGHLAEVNTTKPVFILVEVLEKGQYFGVGDVVFRESQPSLSVVSNGAECLLLSKSFFKQHSCENIINSLRKSEVPYPTEEELQEKLQEHTDWLAYRNSTYHAMADPIMDRKARRKQYTLGYAGQYNFRTGPT